MTAFSAYPQAWTPYTPTVTAVSGTFTAASGTGSYAQFGKTILYRVDLTITTVGTGSGCLFSLPVTASAGAGVIGAAREDATTGNEGIVKLNSNTQGSVARYDNGNIVSGGSGSIVRAYGSYDAA